MEKEAELLTGFTLIILRFGVGAELQQLRQENLIIVVSIAEEVQQRCSSKMIARFQINTKFYHLANCTNAPLSAIAPSETGQRKTAGIVLNIRICPGKPEIRMGIFHAPRSTGVVKGGICNAVSNVL